MSTSDYNTLGRMPLSEIPNQPAEIVIEWLQNQHQAVGEAVAKLCYQRLTEQRLPLSCQQN